VLSGLSLRHFAPSGSLEAGAEGDGETGSALFLMGHARATMRDVALSSEIGTIEMGTE
ncbi:unnamed protein product, partial [Prorocentrum cordatum]